MLKKRTVFLFLLQCSILSTLFVMLTDAAPVNVLHVYITIDSVSALRQGYSNEPWVNLAFVNNVTEVYFDLLALQDVAMNLSIVEIPPGNYTMIKMHVKTANATYPDGSTSELDVRGGYLKILIRFEIEKDQTTAVLIDVQPDCVTQNNKLKPIVKATVVP